MFLNKIRELKERLLPSPSPVEIPWQDHKIIELTTRVICLERVERCRRALELHLDESNCPNTAGPCPDHGDVERWRAFSKKMGIWNSTRLKLIEDLRLAQAQVG